MFPSFCHYVFDNVFWRIRTKNRLPGFGIHACKTGNDSIYMQVENLWRKIHLQRQKDSIILDWGVWAVVLPSDTNGEYQYVVATVYPSFSAYLDPYANMDIHKIFPGISDDSINHMFAKTGEARDLLRSSVFQIVFSEGLGGKPVPKYVLATQMKAAPGKESDYESLEMKDWRPIHKDLIKNGYESAFNFSRAFISGRCQLSI